MRKLCIVSKFELFQSNFLNSLFFSALAFSADSNIFLTGCTLGNIRLFLIKDFEVESIEPDCSIDCAHDMGVLGADFCKITHSDRK